MARNGQSRDEDEWLYTHPPRKYRGNIICVSMSKKSLAGEYHGNKSSTGDMHSFYPLLSHSLVLRQNRKKKAQTINYKTAI